MNLFEIAGAIGSMLYFFSLIIVGPQSKVAKPIFTIAAILSLSYIVYLGINSIGAGIIGFIVYLLFYGFIYLRYFRKGKEKKTA